MRLLAKAVVQDVEKARASVGAAFLKRPSITARDTGPCAR